jgi:hypothetical protein
VFAGVDRADRPFDRDPEVFQKRNGDAHIGDFGVGQPGGGLETGERNGPRQPTGGNSKENRRRGGGAKGNGPSRAFAGHTSGPGPTASRGGAVDGEIKRLPNPSAPPAIMTPTWWSTPTASGPPAAHRRVRLRLPE